MLLRDKNGGENMELSIGDYKLNFVNGGIEIKKGEKLLYYNKKPLYISVKTYMAITEFYDAPYNEVIQVNENEIRATGTLAIKTGSEFLFTDVYEVKGKVIKVTRKVKVTKVGTDLGFGSKFSLIMNESDDPRDYYCFAPGAWYKQNEFAPEYVMGKDLDNEYFWQFETRFALPLFAMQNITSGETIALSRWASDISMRSLDIFPAENYVDPKFTIGSIGMSKPKSKTLNYMYYGFPVRKDIDTVIEGLSIDYVYPGCNGEFPARRRYLGLDYKGKAKTFQRVNHPVKLGFEQNYAIAINLGHYEDFYKMMRDIWRITYERLRDRYFEVDNKLHYHNCMKIFIKYTQKYGKAYGLPFSCQLPNLDVSSVSFQFGFVGQQPGIGNLLIHYGDTESNFEAFQKGVEIIEFWVNNSMTETGLPKVCYHPAIEDFEPYPHYIRMLADGLEAILDAYVYLKVRKGIEKEAWLEYCKKAADWIVDIQNDDGSFYRAYNIDGSMRMESKATTPSIIRFLVYLYLVTDSEKYKIAALKAGEYSYKNVYLSMEYRGGTCDNADILDKEAGIYALFGFLALFDLTKEQKWLEAAIGAADYTETWTYVWKFPVVTPWPKHPFNKYSISGQSIITVGGGADVYMAACAYTYFRLYLITRDEHYLDFAKFIYKNTRQSTDVDGSCGYIMPGLGHESGNFTNQILESHYHWLPWCTFVQVEPIIRLYETFGVFEIEDAMKLSEEMLKKQNDIYDNLLCDLRKSRGGFDDK